MGATVPANLCELRALGYVSAGMATAEDFEEHIESCRLRLGGDLPYGDLQSTHYFPLAYPRGIQYKLIHTITNAGV